MSEIGDQGAHHSEDANYVGPSQERGACSSWLSELRVMLKKNFLMLLRNRRATLIQCLAPFFLAFLLFVINYGLTADKRTKEFVNSDRNPTLYGVHRIPECTATTTPDCTTMAFSPSGDPVVSDIVDKIKAQNGFTKTRAFTDEGTFNNFMVDNVNSTQAAVHFQVSYSGAPSWSNVLSITYAVQNNLTEARYHNQRVVPLYQTTIPYIRAVDEAVLQLTHEKGGGSGNVEFDFTYANYPHPRIANRDTVGDFGPTFFFGALMFNIVMQLGQLVNERELHLRQSMHQMGLSISAYWTSYFITNFVLNTFCVLLLITAGAMFQFDFFLLTEFPVYFFLFWLFGLSLVPFVFFISNFVSKSRTGTILGFAMFLIGTLVQSFVEMIFKDSVNVGIRILFIIQPWALLSQGMKYIGFYAANDNIRGMKWSQIGDNFMSLRDVYLLFLLDAVIYLVLGIYLDHVLPDENGMRRPIFFCCSPSYWRPTTDRVLGTIDAPSGNKRATKQSEMNSPPTENLLGGHEFKSSDEDDGEDAFSAEAIERQLELTKAGLDPDVVKEAKKVRETLDVNYPVRISQLGITFYATFCCCIRQPEKDFQAVREINLLLDRNSLFCLLGHNGAGKSTTINMMTGLLPPTAGDARVMGYSIKSSMHEIKKFMGVCPQHDVLWNELTAAEHLELFAVFKKLDPELVEKEVNDRLADVGLTKYGNTTAGSFSGGMRRRLSVAIALIGDPQIVYLDEPTTGMDPISRRQVWDLVERVKYDRVTVLTTHSMEEADVLGDRIGIMKEGKFICLGSSVRLKNKFGTGYRLTVMVDAGLPSSERKILLKNIEKFMKDNLPEAELDFVEQDSTRFRIPRSATNKLIDFFTVLEQKKEDLSIADVQVSLTTLEEVFLSVGAIGEDHADERFGVSSQVGTELVKALKRLEEIRSIQDQQKRAEESAEARAELERRQKEEALLEVDNSPEAIAEELPQLLEIEAVSERIELLKSNFERNVYEPYNSASVEQQRHWDEIIAEGRHLNLDCILGSILRQKSGGAQVGFSKGGEKQTIQTTQFSGSNADCKVELVNLGGMLASANESVADDDEEESGTYPVASEKATQVRVQPREGPYPAPSNPPSPPSPSGQPISVNSIKIDKNDGDYSHPKSHEEKDAFADLSAEMAAEQEQVLKDWLKVTLLNKRKPLFANFRKWFSKLTIVQKILFFLGIILVVVIIAGIVSSASSSDDDEYSVPVTQFNAEPSFTDLPTAQWSEIFPQGNEYLCARQEKFAYYVYKPASTDNPNNDVFVHFGNGDTCYNKATCDPNIATMRYRDNLIITQASFRAGNTTGVFQKTHNDNPLKNYIHVYIPHCSADGFIGSTDVNYEAGLRTKHMGAHHADVALRWLKTNVASASSNIVVAASGEHVLGGALWAYWVRSNWPNAKVTFISDHIYDLKTIDVQLQTTGSGVQLGSSSTPFVNYIPHIKPVFENRGSNLASIYGATNSNVPNLNSVVTTLTQARAFDPTEVMKAMYDLDNAKTQIVHIASASGSQYLAPTIVGVRSSKTLFDSIPAATLNPVLLVSATAPVDMYSRWDTNVQMKPNMVTDAQRAGFDNAWRQAICLEMHSRVTETQTKIASASAAHSILTPPIASMVNIPPQQFPSVEVNNVIESGAFYFDNAVTFGTSQYSVAKWLANILTTTTALTQSNPPSCIQG